MDKVGATMEKKTPHVGAECTKGSFGKPGVVTNGRVILGGEKDP